MRLGGLDSSFTTRDVPTLADALRRAAAELGQRPAITVLRGDRRAEQGFGSLHKWTAKGAHLLRDEWGAEPGDLVVHLDAPPDWTSAIVCYATWWLGGTISIGGTGGDDDVRVAHETRLATHGAPADLLLGDAVDGGPTEPDVEGDPWTSAAQIHPDDPPPAYDDAGPALRGTDGAVLSQSELLDAARRWGTEGALGVTPSDPPSLWLPAIVRPLLTGAGTVIVTGDADPSAVEREAIRRWAGR